MATTNEKVEFVDDIPQDGRNRYPALLEQVKKGSIGPQAGKWAKLVDFPNTGSGADAAARLRRENKDFDFTTRIHHSDDAEGTKYMRIYARYNGANT